MTTTTSVFLPDEQEQQITQETIAICATNRAWKRRDRFG